jgi:hypothetical protein
MNDELWLPRSARRRLKRDRLDSTDYKQAVTIDPAGELTYDAFISASQEEWLGQFTPAERQGPISFNHYMGLQLETLNWRVNEDIPNSLSTGAINKIEHDGSLEFFRRLRDFTDRYLRLKGVL